MPFTRAGCDVGGVATANMELENTAVDIPKVFGPNSPEAKQLAADTDSFKDAETADYIGVAVHCAQGQQATFCATAKAVKFGQTKPTHTAVPDLLPDEPGGYTGFQALFGHRYVAPQLGRRDAEPHPHGFQVTNAAGNLVDLNGNQLDGAFLTNHPGFPGFGNINASQTLAYMADMLESGVPVVYGYMADLHGNEHIPGLSGLRQRPGRARQRQRLLHRAGAVLQPGLRDLLQAPRRRRDHAEEHAVRLQLGRGRPRSRRERRPGGPAHAGQLRRRDGDRQHGHARTSLCTYPAGTLRRAGRQHQRPAGHPEAQHHPVQPGGGHGAGVLRDRQARA